MAASSASGPLSMVRVLSLNVWFDLKLRRARTQALAEVVRSCSPSLCCFQEVVPEVAVQLMQALPGWISSDPGDGSTLGPYGVMMLAQPGLRPAFSFHDLPTGMARRLLVAELNDLSVATAHLESLANQRTREAQLQVCRDVLAARPDAVLAGDFNFDSERNFGPPHKPLDNEALGQYLPGYTDVWAALRPAERGLTFDSEVNPYIGSFEQMRYDRVMAKLRGWAETAIELAGHVPVDRFVELSAREQVELERPPTPPRPNPKVRRAPDFADLGGFSLDAPDDELAGTAQPSDLGVGLGEPSTPPPSLASSARDALDSIGDAKGFSSPAAAADKRRRLFLSDHFGLLATFAKPLDLRAAGPTT